MDAEELRALVIQSLARARAAFQALLVQIRRLAAPILAAWARFAIERWERVRAYLATHPDLADLDAWMDRWYSFGTA